MSPIDPSLEVIADRLDRLTHLVERGFERQDMQAVQLAARVLELEKWRTGREAADAERAKIAAQAFQDDDDDRTGSPVVRIIVALGGALAAIAGAIAAALGAK